MSVQDNGKFNVVMDSVPVFLVIVRVDDHRIIYCNQMAQQLFGEDGIGKTCAEFFNREGLQEKVFTHQESSVFDEQLNGRWYHILNTSIIWNDNQASRLLSGVDITDIKTVDGRVPVIVTTDSLTGLLSSKTGLDYLDYYLQDVRANNSNISVCYVSINALDYINDNFGSQESDECIKAVVSCIKPSIRRTDVFARMHGGEFLLIFPNCQYEVVENIMAIVANKLKFINDSKSKSYSISYGIMDVNSETTLDAKHILDTVDKKMHYMKDLM